HVLPGAPATILAAPGIGSSAANSLYSHVRYDDSRIQNHLDKLLLSRMKEYFISFMDGDFDGMRDLQADDFHITHIPLRTVRADRDTWYEVNRGFSSLLTDVEVVALNIGGSSLPGSFGILENVLSFTLAVDPPEEAKPYLHPGMKKGDSASMIMTSLIWWNLEGKIYRDLEYGQLTWSDFDINQFDACWGSFDTDVGCDKLKHPSEAKIAVSLVYYSSPHMLTYHIHVFGHLQRRVFLLTSEENITMKSSVPQILEALERKTEYNKASPQETRHALVNESIPSSIARTDMEGLAEQVDDIAQRHEMSNDSASEQSSAAGRDVF
ncbi:hypothetical protein V491_00571, partial [Pseudogymnoascus sp. VKM F-3775]